VTWDADLEELMPATIVVKPPARPGSDGADAYSTAAGSTYRARVSYDPDAIRRASGTVEGVTAVVWFPSTAPVDLGSKVTLPDGTTPPVKGSALMSDETGAHHVKLLLGW
jgi:hypothetical protein